MARSEFWDFARRLEAQPHAAPHNNLGGDMSSMAAPNDPIFWLHHAMIDRIYASWQVNNPNKYIPDGEDEPLPVYSQTTVKDTFDTRAYPYCYEYASLISSSSPTDIPHPRSPQSSNPQQRNFGPTQPNPNSNFKTSPRPQPTLTRRSNTVQQEATSTIHLEVQPGVSLAIDLVQIANETNAWALLQRICPTTLCPTKPSKSKPKLIHLPRPVNEGWIKNNNYPILNFRFYEIQYAIHIYNKNLEISRKPKKCKPKSPNLMKYQ
ncbi:hypothetical protein DSO57_1005315 [Entomophthora muscae]|uniref:Uncharacterized protein n=1 Tax=Entomophthora muscae TaxID=34485 RepID=A0ACC2USR9_9FUNG|nr:hypothetical protein DSO57_1005315 [Entomophthora muscae]